MAWLYNLRHVMSCQLRLKPTCLNICFSYYGFFNIYFHQAKNGKLVFNNYRVTNMNGRTRVQIRAFLVSALNASQW
jgi:hypothetical protein